MMNIDAECRVQMYDKIESMTIDDNWEILKLSDHNLINIKIRTQREINKFVKMKRNI